MIGALTLELHGELGDLEFGVVDQPEADVEVVSPRVGDREAVKQLAAGVPEQTETGHG